jgi:hypothetical protein
LNVYTDNSVPYDAWFVMGSIQLVNAGQISILKFLQADFSGFQYKPTVGYLINEIFGSFTEFTLDPQPDPPSIYGSTIFPQSYSPNRYYFSGTGSLARAKNIQIYVDFGVTSNPDEIFNLTLFGRTFVET